MKKRREAGTGSTAKTALQAMPKLGIPQTWEKKVFDFFKGGESQSIGISSSPWFCCKVGDGGEGRLKKVVYSCMPQVSQYIEPGVQLTRLCVGKPDVKHQAHEMSICLDR